MTNRNISNRVIAIVLIVAIVIAAGLTHLLDATYWFELKTAKEYFDNKFRDEFSLMLNGFSYRWETDEEKLRLASDITAHSYSAMFLFHQTSYTNNEDLNDVVVIMYSLSNIGRAFEAVDEETVSDLTALSFDINNRDLARKIADKLAKQQSEQLSIVNGSHNG